MSPIYVRKGGVWVATTASSGSITPPPSASPPGSIASLTVTVTSSSITMNWTAAVDPDGDLAGYQVYLNGSPYGKIGLDLTTTLTGLRSSTAYTVGVAAYDSGNRLGPVTSKATTTSASTSTGTKPTADNTGVPPGTTLTTWTGSSTLSTPGVYDSIYFSTGVKINVAGVTLRNCKVNGGIVNYFPNFALYDCNVAGNVNCDAYYRPISNVRYRGVHNHCKASDGFDFFSSANGTVSDVDMRDCLVEGFDFSSNATSHGDCVQMRGVTGITIYNCVLDMGPWQRVTDPATGKVYNPKNSSIYLENVFGGNHNVLIDTVWINGGRYTFYTATTDNTCTIRNARFGRDYGSGPTAETGNVVTWNYESTNVWDDTGLFVPLKAIP